MNEKNTDNFMQYKYEKIFNHKINNYFIKIK